MGLKVPATSLQWPQPSVHQSPPSSQALASAISSTSSTSSLRRSVSLGDIYRFGKFASQQPSTRLYKSHSCDNLRSWARPIVRALSASLDSLPDDEFDKGNQESDIRSKSYEEGCKESSNIESFEFSFEGGANGSSGEVNFLKNMEPFADLKPPPKRDEIVKPNIVGIANYLGIPSSPTITMMINHKNQWQEGLVGAGESAYCSVKKAFSSMVFIIQELHSHTLRMREVLFYEDLQGILASVQKEMNDSFVWLFQKIFSQTPNLMVCLMILLANYSVYSMSNYASIAAPMEAYTIPTMEMASVFEGEGLTNQKFDPLAVKTFKPSSTSVGGNNGGGGKFGTITSGTDGNDRSDESNYYTTVTPNVISSGETLSMTNKQQQISSDEETLIWESMVDEARKMNADSLYEALDNGPMLKFVSPVDAKAEAEDSSEHLRTEFLYQTGLAREPENPLLLANYAQFLYVVARDYDRAEEYFKRATKAEPKDAESFNKYANFLWLVREDMWAAEEAYIEAMDVEPHNSYYSANYAHFLWNTGGEDTCIV